MLMFAGCAPDSRAPAQASSESGSAPSTSTTLTMAIRYEPTALSLKMTAQAGGDFVKQPFNATLAYIDGDGNAQPMLAERLPELNTETWRVFPDGRMETIHRLRPNVTWQDGQPLTARDFIFGYQLSSNPALGAFSPKPQDQMEEVLAPDPLTVVIRWRSPSPDAATLSENRDGGLEPMPRHLLEAGYERVVQDASAKDAFLSLPYWTHEYVGLGPYRLQRWDPGSHLEGLAFPEYVLGRPKVNRIIMRIIADENTTLTNMLAGSIDVATKYTLRFEQGQVLRREWPANTRGGILVAVNGGQYAMVQFRPEFLKVPELMDVRVRRALVHSLDRQSVVDSLFDGEIRPIETFVYPNVPYYATLDRAMVHYSYDPRRTEQLMNEAGFAKDSGGVFANGAGERFRPEFQSLGSTLFEQAQAIFVDAWSRAGIQTQPTVLPASQVRDNEARNTFNAIASAGGVLDGWLGFTSAEIGTRSNRWTGRNRGGWSNAEYDRLWDEFNSTISRPERERLLGQIARVLSEELPAWPLYAQADVWAHARHVKGVNPGSTETRPLWNIHTWEAS
jgi:peptide/nickel transport system substrate-binding protein